MHAEEKPFECKQYTDKCFSWAGTLWQHEKIHTGEKPFECKHCGKCFGYSGHLEEHTCKRTHTVEKPYECEQCVKSFSQAVHLKKHKKVTHLKDLKDSHSVQGHEWYLKQHQATQKEEEPCTSKRNGQDFSIAELLSDIKNIKQEPEY